MRDYSDLVGAEVTARSNDTKVSPIVIANACMVKLDPEKTSVPEVYELAHMHLRQMARAALARSFDPADKKKRAHDAKAISDLFMLQARYPQAHTADLDDPVYLRREEMTEDDVKYNVARLRAEGRAKLAHADALEAWWGSRVPGEEAAKMEVFEPAE